MDVTKWSTTKEEKVTLNMGERIQRNVYLTTDPITGAEKMA
jgi:hypothetical protein